MAAKLSRKRQRNGRMVRKLDPNLFLFEAVALSTADTAVNTTVFTNSEKQRYLWQYRSCRTILFPSSGGTPTVFWVLRRVPSGYSAPTAVTVATGLTTWIDQPDVIAYACERPLTSYTAPIEAEFTVLKSTVVLFEGDTVVLQAVINETVNANFSGELEFGTAGL